MKHLIFLFVIIFWGCEKYESQILYTQAQLDIINEKTEGVVVFLHNDQVYKVNDLGQNESAIPNTQGARTAISLNYTKDKVAYFNLYNEIVIVNIDGNNKEILTQYNARHFEWSKKEDVLFILENNMSTLSTYGTPTNFTSPTFAVNINVLNFCVSPNYLVAYSAIVSNSPYSDLLYVKDGDDTKYLEVFNSGPPFYASTPTKFNTLEFTSDEKLYGAYIKDNYYLYSFQFDPISQNLSDNSNSEGFEEQWTFDVRDDLNDNVKNAYLYDGNYESFNLYKYRQNKETKKITNISNLSEPIIFDWKK